MGRESCRNAFGSAFSLTLLFQAVCQGRTAPAYRRTSDQAGIRAKAEKQLPKLEASPALKASLWGQHHREPPDIRCPILSHQKEAGRNSPWLGLQGAGKAQVPCSGSRSVFSAQLSSPPPSTSGSSGGSKAVASILKHAGSWATTSTAFHQPQEDVADLGAACPPTHQGGLGPGTPRAPACS